MNVLLNGKRPEQEGAEWLLNRGFRFGDGCFETLLVYQDACPLLSLHLQRLQRSLKAMRLQWPAALELEQLIPQLTLGKEGWHRLRLWVWRAGEGLYTPESEEAHFMLGAVGSEGPQLLIRESCGISQEARLATSSWSHIKSISAQPYVLAGLEKKERGLEELLLLNGRGELAEATSSNIFFRKRGRWFTPALTAGCVSGVMRAHLMRQLLQRGKPVYEVHALPEELEKLDQLICTNVSGLFPVAAVGQKQYNTDIESFWELLPKEYREAF
jgi:4-amino-4-deoxychorismate lyase